MRKVFIDTNVWLRVILKDDETQYIASYRLFKAVEEGKIRAYISGIILMELIYVLRKVYKFSSSEVKEVIQKVLDTRGLYFIDKINTRKALDFYFKYNLKFSDCLIASQLSNDLLFCSFDKDFKKIREVNFTTPEELEIE